ncbi:hypothetical protein GXW82_13595 [Streptacidiphilus sp. 4-A2]|nr:hypothetical protein [Streptacidiphilus sp. 4-A2]
MASDEAYEGLGLDVVAAAEVTAEDVGTLKLEYRNGAPVLVVSDGKAIPSGIPVVDGDGQVVAVYETVAVPKSTALNAASLMEQGLLGINVMTYDYFGGPWTQK